MVENVSYGDVSTAMYAYNNIAGGKSDAIKSAIKAYLRAQMGEE